MFDSINYLFDTSLSNAISHRYYDAMHDSMSELQERFNCMFNQRISIEILRIEQFDSTEKAFDRFTFAIREHAESAQSFDTFDFKRLIRKAFFMFETEQEAYAMLRKVINKLTSE